MSVRVLHAADLHLDSPFEALPGALAAQRRQEQRALLRSLPETARQYGAKILLLPGDLLDSDSAYGETARLLGDVFDGCGCEVFIAPGNHDYYAPDSPYARLRFPENVHIFRENRLTSVELPDLGVRVWGAAFTDRRSAPLLRGWRCPREGQIELLCVHGEVGNTASPYNPISTEELAVCGVDYAALGHVHRFGGVMKAGNTTYAWPGCMEGRGFDETGEKGVLLAEVDRGSAEVRFLPVDGRRYEVLPVDVTDSSPLEAVLSALPEDSPRHIFRVILRGEAERAPNLPALRAALEGMTFALDLRDETRLRQALWSGANEDTLRGLFLSALKTRYDAAATASERQKITQAARWGLAALDGDEEVFPL